MRRTSSVTLRPYTGSRLVRARAHLARSRTPDASAADTSCSRHVAPIIQRAVNGREHRMSTMAPAPLKYQLQGAVFVAQACSCAHDVPTGACTGDPCICGESCPCDGADLYLGPRWRFVGDLVEAGTIAGVDVGQRIFLNLAQTSDEQAHDWQEVVLIDDQATPDQVRVLLDLFAQRQGSEPTHPDIRPTQARSVYLVPMRYRVVQGRPTLCVTFSLQRSHLVHGIVPAPIQAWTYNGRVALREHLGQ